jgi:hypothetical protein
MSFSASTTKQCPASLHLSPALRVMNFSVDCRRIAQAANLPHRQIGGMADQPILDLSTTRGGNTPPPRQCGPRRGLRANATLAHCAATPPPVTLAASRAPHTALSADGPHAPSAPRTARGYRRQLSGRRNLVALHRLSHDAQQQRDDRMRRLGVAFPSRRRAFQISEQSGHDLALSVDCFGRRAIGGDSDCDLGEETIVEAAAFVGPIALPHFLQNRAPGLTECFARLANQLPLRSAFLAERGVRRMSWLQDGQRTEPPVTPVPTTLCANR